MKKKKRLIWKIYPSYLLIILIALAAVTAYTFNSFQQFFTQRTIEELDIQSQLLKKQMIRALSSPDPTSVDHLCKEIAANLPTRITVILHNGKVIGDSDDFPQNMNNHGDRPEVIQAISGIRGVAVRYSTTLQKRMMYVAVPLENIDGIQGVLRVSIALTAIDDALKSFITRMAFGGILIALIASGICLYISRRISHPIEEMRQGAERFAAGELTHKLPTPNTREMASLAEAMNLMADRLKERIETVINQRNEIEAMLSSMTEGIIAVDMDDHVLRMNHAASRMLDTHVDISNGRSIYEIVRSRDLHGFVDETLSHGKIACGDIVLHQHGERILNVNSIPLRDFDGNRIGALVVLNDVTQIRHLENVRTDFVSNVSHEIKTPLTAIKGFVETLQHGAIDDPQEAKNFLGIIEKHVNRLTAIVEDLLLLSRMEQDDDMQNIPLEESSVSQVIKSAMQLCRAKAAEKQIQIECACEEDFSARINIPLLEQAVINLMDNAIKYSGENDMITVNVIRSDGKIVISIQDQGIGIQKTHLPRIFERFYRVDKSRSRKLGGTGLGLSIVKHIIQAHGGHVTVESTLGKGSTFRIHLPVIPENSSSVPISHQ